MSRRPIKYRTVTDRKIAIAAWAMAAVIGCFLIVAVTFFVGGLI